MNTLPTLAIIGPGKVGTSMGILAAHTSTFGIQSVSSKCRLAEKMLSEFESVWLLYKILKK